MVGLWSDVINVTNGFISIVSDFNRKIQKILDMSVINVSFDSVPRSLNESSTAFAEESMMGVRWLNVIIVAIGFTSTAWDTCQTIITSRIICIYAQIARQQGMFSNHRLLKFILQRQPVNP
eukprot:670738_1